MCIGQIVVIKKEKKSLKFFEEYSYISLKEKENNSLICVAVGYTCLPNFLSALNSSPKDVLFNGLCVYLSLIMCTLFIKKKKLPITA